MPPKLKTRKLKIYVASVGFFDLAVAAPSMKAAADAWGSGGNLFKFGMAKETDDPAIVAATMAKPGVVLRRPVGTTGAFKEHAELPKVASAGKTARKPAEPAPPPPPPPPPKPTAKVDDAAARKAAAVFAKEQQRRERERRKQEAAQEKARRKREQAIAKAEAALAQAQARHETVMRDLAAGREALEKQSAAETARWDKEREHLAAALRRART